MYRRALAPACKHARRNAVNEKNDATLALGLLLLVAAGAAAESRVPLTDLRGGTYRGFRGGLHENGLDSMPADHLAWDLPDERNYRLIREQKLTPTGLTEAQVQVAWVKLANRQPTVALPSDDADAWRLVEQLGNTVRSLKAHYPNLRMVYLSSRI